MANASIKAMIPMTMIGKNFKGRRDKICAATASPSANQRDRGVGSWGASILSGGKLKSSHVYCVPSVPRKCWPKDSLLFSVNDHVVQVSLSHPALCPMAVG